MVPRPAAYDPRMVLAIDVGNSALKVARVADGRVGPVTRLATTSGSGSGSSGAGPDGVPEALASLLAQATEGVALVSVVPAWTDRIRHVVGRDPDRRLIVATHTTIPLEVRLASPATVGADRLLGAWAARELVGAPCIVVDVGTATTVDVVDASGAFVGGAILPGPVLAMRSLARGTALLPPVPLVPPDHAIGRDTLQAIASGVLLGHRDAVGGLVARMAAELGEGATPRVVLTGGDAHVVADAEWVDRTEPDLLLWGLGLLAERLPAARPVGARA